MTISEIERKCIVCGKQMKIRLMDNGEYSGAHYFGKIEIPIGEGMYRKIGRSKLLNMAVDVVEWTGEFREEEYWECEKCFQEE